MSKPFAIVTGASSGIGLELATICAQEGFDLLMAADRPEIEAAADRCRECGAAVQVVQTDLATTAGVDQLWTAAAGRPVDALLANAGHGLGHAFLDQDFEDARHVIDTNITGTIYLVQLVGRTMRSRGKGRILLTGSIAGFMPKPGRFGSRARISGCCSWRASTGLVCCRSDPASGRRSSTCRASERKCPRSFQRSAAH